MDIDYHNARSTPRPSSDRRMISAKADRPSSRRGMSPKAISVDDRPLTARPLTIQSKSSFGRPGSSARNVMPGTASRLATAMMNHPPSRAGTSMGLSSSPFNVVDRPITQQGLSGLRPETRGPQFRQVKDKRYFEGVLQMKIRKISNEISKIQKDNDNIKKEQATFLVYDKKVKELASELTDLQGQLADYNLVVDKLNTDTAKEDVEMETKELKIQNNEESKKLEELFAHKQQKEAIIHQIEMEIQQERNMTNNLLSAMNPQLRTKYSELEQVNSTNQKNMEQLQDKLDELTSKKTHLEDQISISHNKQEAVRLYHKLREVELKRDELIEEEKNRTTPQQEREILLQKVKEDNQEMSSLEKQISEIKEIIKRKQDELDQLDQDLEESQSDRHQKFREYKRREEMMDQFISNYDEQRNEELTRLETYEKDIVLSLERTSRYLARTGVMPTTEDYLSIKENLSFKEGELEKSKNTIGGLSHEHVQLESNLKKVHDLEGKINSEMAFLRERMHTMTSSLDELQDIEGLKAKVQHRQTELTSEREELLTLKPQLTSQVNELEREYENIQKDLDVEAQIQLNNLEKKLANIEQNNFIIKEFILSKKAETAYELLKKKTFDLCKDFNGMLIDNLRKGH